MDMKDKVAVVTGASSGIGRATAHAFAKQGGKLVLAARSSDQLEEVERECADLGVRAVAVPTDVGVWAEVEELAARRAGVRPLRRLGERRRRATDRPDRRGAGRGFRAGDPH